VNDVKTLPGADIDSDHNLLVAKFQTRLKKIIRFQKNCLLKEVIEGTIKGRIEVTG
jgi:hypothetical protein